MYVYFIIILGLCITTTALSGISVTTMQPAPIFTLLPIVILSMTFAPVPIKTLSFYCWRQCFVVQFFLIVTHLEKKQLIGL